MTSAEADPVEVRVRVRRDDVHAGDQPRTDELFVPARTTLAQVVGHLVGGRFELPLIGSTRWIAEFVASGQGQSFGRTPLLAVLVAEDGKATVLPLAPSLLDRSCADLTRRSAAAGIDLHFSYHPGGPVPLRVFSGQNNLSVRGGQRWSP
jgi:hypothetical protein